LGHPVYVSEIKKYITSMLRVEENGKHAIQAGQQVAVTDSNLFHWPIIAS
jgi:hypothetical protein